MAGFPYEPFPARPFFSCETSSFKIIDRARLSQIMKGEEDPWMTLSVGERNVIDSRPLRVRSHEELEIEIECESGVLKLDMQSESARKTDPTGREWIYCGGLDEANSGLGWMPVS